MLKFSEGQQITKTKMTKPKIVHLVTNHPVDDVRVSFRECRSLQEAGFDVTLVAADTTSQPLPDVRTIVVEPSPGRLARILKTQFRAVRVVRKLRPTLIHFHDPELLPSAFVLQLLGHKVVYDVHEDMPKVIQSRYWLNPRVRPLLSSLMAATEWLAGKTLSGIVTTVPSIYKRFPSDKTILVQNFPSKSEITDAATTVPYAQREEGLICWAGSLSVARGALAMAETLARVKTPGAHLALAGRFDPVDLVDEVIETCGADRVEILGLVDRPAVLELYNRSQIGLMMYEPTPSYVESQPVKLFEYMAAGIPIVASDFPFIRSVLETHDCGITIDPTDPEAAARAIDFLLANPDEAEAMGARGRVAAELFTWESEFEALLGLYNRILGTG